MIKYSSEADLRKALHAALQPGSSVVLATVSMDDAPSTSFCSWVLGLGPNDIAVAVDSRSTAYSNISNGSTNIALEVMADDLIAGVRGTAAIVKTQLSSVPFPCALVMVRIGEVRSHSVLGVHFKAPRYVFAVGKEHRGEIEREIFEEMKQSGLSMLDGKAEDVK